MKSGRKARKARAQAKIDRRHSTDAAIALNKRIKEYGHQARGIMNRKKLNPDAFMGDHLLNMIMRELETGRTPEDIAVWIESRPFYSQYWEHQEFLKSRERKREAKGQLKPDPWKVAKLQGQTRPTYADVMNIPPVQELPPVVAHNVPKQLDQVKPEAGSKSQFENPRTYGIPNMAVNGRIKKPAPVRVAAPAPVEEVKPAKDIKDPVIVNGVEYRSTRAAMETMGIGEDKHARVFRLAVKAKGEDIWTCDGKQYRFELKNKRPEQIAAIEQQRQELIDRERQANGRVSEVFQRDPQAQSQFREWVRENFAFRCAVTGKHLGGVLEAAHIEAAAVEGCYNASNGVLLAPTFHKLYDRHLMGINPDTMTVHFAPGIEWEEYEGKVITPLVYRLDKDRLAARWAKFKGKK